MACATANIEGLKMLSPELMRMVIDHVDDFPIGTDEANEIRKQLMDERKEYSQASSKARCLSPRRFLWILIA